MQRKGEDCDEYKQKKMVMWHVYVLWEVLFRCLQIQLNLILLYREILFLREQ